jgi:hypothetical protein
MSRSTTSVLVSIATIAMLLILAMTNGIYAPAPQIRVIEVNRAIMLGDKAKVSLFINELMIPRQASCLKWILTKESHMNPKAKNKHSSAKGVGQLLESTYKNIGLKHSADPMAQVVASIAYISRHYGNGSACAAKAFWLKHSYY